MEEKKLPLVSVVVPCYNHEKYVKETIESIINQTYQNIELIVIDDGSKDNSVKVIESLIPKCKERFSRFEFRHRPNKGLCATLNEALEWCDGKYYSACASDDVLIENKIELQVKYMQNNPKSIGVFGGIQMIDDKKNIIKTISKPNTKYTFEDIFLHKHFLPAPTALLKLNSVKNIGGYREELIIEDWSMWLFLTEQGQTLDLLENVLAKYRRHDGNLSVQSEKMHKGRLQIIDLYKKHKLYKEALSRVYIIKAREAIKVNDKESLNSIFKSILNQPKIIFSIPFIKYIVMFLMRQKAY
ncbi:glycosyltransferase family 2 protein [Aliarcobacter thereius]|uniref:glycosyltransferase family 2 protein n=1 Tax=Aliarcobacter thereius TaxID=544718 RepID=UPI000825FA66|nr:glycosyltransferase [Aliarcobacter thereius]OCL91218.1 putative glycosyltransferase EpsE [Aliarcobacter thereius]TLT06350.1 glycosyltransferase [Aliarcobacter thereius]